MTEKEFLNYKGLKTKGSDKGCNFEGGIIVGYRKDCIPTEYQSLIAFFNDDRGWTDIESSEIVVLDVKGFFLGRIPNGTFLYVSLENLVIETEKEEKELDLTKILNDCEGVELFSEVFGVGEVHKVDDFVCVKSKKGFLHYFNHNGRLTYYPDGNCLLWPSETCRDWSQFKKPIKIKEGDWVVCGWSVRDVVIRRYFKDDKCFNVDSSTTLEWAFIAPFEKYDPTLSDDELLKLSIV